MSPVEGWLFRKTDLHIHTPQSTCYSEPEATAEQIVAAALDAHLEVVAITDHNTVEAVDAVRQIGAEQGLFVFPGVELTTKGGHFICLFELDTPVDRLREFLDDVGIAREGWGDAATMSTLATEEAMARAEEWGGLVIAAHVERWPSGFLKTNEPRQAKMQIHSSQHLSALEITIPQDKGLWNSGRVRNYPKKYACIQGSDAHAVGEIGRRPVYIYMDVVGLEALRAAFSDYQTRIYFPDELALSEQ